ncbi:MAG: helix-turn-helix domain-containing protein [Gaiellaceae bacterium]
MSQLELADPEGIPIATYGRLERGDVRNPSIRPLVNCAIVLLTPVEESKEQRRLTGISRDATLETMRRRKRS